MYKLTRLFLVILAMGLVAGCATGGKVSDEDLVMGVVEGWQTAINERNADGMKNVLSDDYIDGQGMTKENIVELLP